MDGSGFGSGFLSGFNSGGFLDLESPLYRHEQTVGQSSINNQHPIDLMGCLENNPNSLGVMDMKRSKPKGFTMNFPKEKVVSPVNASNSGNGSEEDEMNFTEEDECGENCRRGEGKKGRQWQRMKWTDKIIKLLIAIVAYAGGDPIEGYDGNKRKQGSLQRKGKWRSVSKIMISKGCHVSPQQCEDKFNDLNKRYKKLNDILGRGTSCQVVENPSLMDLMPHLSEKSKEEVRKILNSKHLFYKEMCAYHNGQKIPNCDDRDLQGYTIVHDSCSKENYVSEEEEPNDDTEDDESDDSECGKRKKEIEEDMYLVSPSGTLDAFKVQLSENFDDPVKSLRERMQWIEEKELELHERKVELHAESFELEKQRFKWVRYCSKKDEELEKLRVENASIRLANEQSILQLRRKEQEMQLWKSSTSMDPTNHGVNRPQGKDCHVELARRQ